MNCIELGVYLDCIHAVTKNPLMKHAQHLMRAAFLRTVIALLAMTACGVAASQETAAGVLAKMAETYAGLRSYQDKGSVRYDILGTQQEVTFKTAFVRPRFRFEWTTHHPFAPLRFVETKSVVRFDGAKAYTWRKYFLKNATEEPQESLALAVAGATGVSSGSAHTIATLLIPDLWKESPFGSAVSDLGDAKVVGMEQIDGVDCYRVSGMRRGERMDVWIGRNDYLIRKLEYLLKGNKNVELRESLVVNQEVPPALFSSAVEK